MRHLVVARRQKIICNLGIRQFSCMSKDSRWLRSIGGKGAAEINVCLKGTRERGKIKGLFSSVVLLTGQRTGKVKEQ